MGRVRKIAALTFAAGIALLCAGCGSYGGAGYYDYPAYYGYPYPYSTYGGLLHEPYYGSSVVGYRYNQFNKGYARGFGYHGFRGYR